MTIYYVYFTDKCKDDAGKHSTTDDVRNLADKLEQEQNIRGLQRHPNRYLKKCMGKQGRLLIQEYRTDDDVVLCFARYLIRGGSEYKSFCKDTDSYYKKNGIPEVDIKKFLEKRKKEPIPSRKQLSDTEHAYLLSPPSNNSIDDGTLMESYDWFNRISKSWANDRLIRYYDLLFKLIDTKNDRKDKTVILDENNKDINILYRYFQEHNLIFLIAPINLEKKDDEAELREKYKEVLISRTSREDVVRISRRAYPEIIAYDEEIWKKVQNSTEANLALSPEEENILESVLLPNGEGQKYPIFINGRPGSGKSTILQYLFSEHLRRYIETDIANSSSIPPPLYLTYSTPLLEQARSSIADILECSSKHLQNDHTLQIGDKFGKKSFRNFREFLREQLPNEMRENFVTASYIDFGKFSKLWNAKRNKHPKSEVRNITPELAWHTIRTFIKGMQHDSGAEIDPEFYEIELARDSKSVSDESFKLIYEYVWEGWYQPLCAKESSWDDQDLAHSVLEHSVDKLSIYPAVFCDEAQDFTNIELELIERLSLYSDRELPGFLAKNVPFGFAGDPFQTLNPTGFNWNAVQSSFYDKIIRQLDSSGSAKLYFNFKELSFNYRSSEEIVKLVNLIQLLRGVLLNIKGIRPQQSWARKITVSPIWFRSDDAGCQSMIREQEELVIIIPCQENGEQEYVENDPFLSKIALQDGQISRNILSSARAKGLEYDRVLLYGFGSEAAKRVPFLLEYIQKPSSEPPKIEQRLALEYFLNQFYVATSRARKRLFIVDSNEAIKNFWAFAEPKKQYELQTLYDNGEWSSENLGGIMQGDDASWSDDRDDPLKLAQRWKAQGMVQRDPYQLNLAKLNFERAQYLEEAKLCEAHVYQFKEEFTKAGNLFKELRQAEEACYCYWAGEDSKAVINLVENFPEISNNPRFLAANAITRNKNDARQINDVVTALEKIQPVPFPDGSDEIPAWRVFFQKFIIKVNQAIEDSDRDHLDWKNSVERIALVIGCLGISIKVYPDFAKLYFLVGNSKKALEHWENCSPSRKQDEPRWLLQAQAEIAPYPNNISYLYRLEDYETVVKVWKNSGSGVAKEVSTNLVLKSAIKMNNTSVIRELLPTSSDIEAIREICQPGKENVLSELYGAIPIAVIQWLESNSKWSQIVDYSTTGRVPDKLMNKQLEAMHIQWNPINIIAAAVRVLARSKRLADENKQSQKMISEFLKQSLIVENTIKSEQKNVITSVHSLVDIREIGAAFERAFRLTYAIEYYEQWFMKNSIGKNILTLSTENVNFAKQRWLMCKYRLGNTQKSQRSERHIKEAEKMEQEWQLPIDTQPRYPNLGPVVALDIRDHQKTMSTTETTPKVSSVPGRESVAQIAFVNDQLIIDDLKLDVKFLMKKQRIIFTRALTEDQVCCGPKEVFSEDVSVELINTSTSLKIWKILEWNIFFEIQFNNNNFVIRLKTDNDNLIIGFELNLPK